jgi:two-component system alkaline phosphatase synthesis response regulator PhoP
VTSILVVEDDPVLCEVLKDGLEHEGYRVQTVADGRAAVAAVRSEPPDLVVLDVMLPALSGLDVCRQLRSSGDGTPIIMLTARGLETDRVRGLRLGADDYLAKPFGFSELLARIEAVLRRCAPASSASSPTSRIDGTRSSPAKSSCAPCGAIGVRRKRGRWTSTSPVCARSSNERLPPRGCS